MVFQQKKYHNMSAKIQKITIALPKKEVSNEELAKEFPDYNFERFEKRVGIKNRYVSTKNESVVSLAINAAEKLFKTSSIKKEDIDFLVLCTQSPDYKLPTSACILQDKLSLRTDIAAFDFNLGCSGYVYGLMLAKSLVSKERKNLLLITSETYSKYIHPRDRANRLIFGDAAAATLIQYDNENKIGNFIFGTDGSGFDKLIIKNGGGKYLVQQNINLKKYGSDNFYDDNHLYMDGPEIYNFTSTKIPNIISQTLLKNNLNIDSIDNFILHQANKLLLNQIRVSLKIPPEKFEINLRNYGNTVSSTIPIALKEYLDRRDKKNINQNIVLTGFGVGLSWASCIIKI